MKVVVNKCYGGFGLSDAAYERMGELGIPIQAYISEERDKETGFIIHEPKNDGKIIFDDKQSIKQIGRVSGNRYWDCWTRWHENRTDPCLVQVVEELGKKASYPLANLQVVEIPDDIEWEIEEYDGFEWISEAHRRW